VACLICDSCQKVLHKKNLNVHLVMSQTEYQKRQKNTSDTESEKTASLEIRIDAIRELNREQRMQSADNQPQIWIILDAHLLTHQAANAFLKTLEEPQNNQYLILLVPSAKAILPTVASRCQRLVFPNVSSLDNINLTKELFEQIQNADISQRISLIEQLQKEKDSLPEKLSNLQLFMMHLIRTSLSTSLNIKNRQTTTQLIEALETAQRDIKAHINLQLILEHLLLQVWPLYSISKSKLTFDISP